MKYQKLKAISLNIVSGGTPLRSNFSYYEGGTIPWLKTGDIKKGFIYDVDEYITELGLENSSAKLLPKNTIIIAMYGDGGTAGSVGINKIPLATNQACCNCIIDSQKADYLYVYYYLKGSYTHLVNLKSGGSQQNLNSKTLKDFEIWLPELPIQKKISAILFAYDDLIENNKKRIQILENMAEELYKEWFVRFRFPNYENTEFEKGVPKDWTYVNLLELADITYGYAFDSTKFNNERIGRKIIRIRNIPISRSSDYTDEVPHDKYLIQTGDLLVGMDGDFHMNRWFDEESYLVQRSCRIKSKHNIHSAYIRQAIKAPIHFFQSTILGATVGHLGAKHLNSIEILMPSSNHENLFSELNRLDKLSLNLELQNRKLEVMRDNLLPRLISGKLSVESLDIQFPPSMKEQ